MTIQFHGKQYPNTAALVAALEPDIHADVQTVLEVLTHYIREEEAEADRIWGEVYNYQVGERPTVYNDDSGYAALERIAKFVGIDDDLEY